MWQKLSKYFIPFIFLASLYLVFNRHSRSTFNNYHSINWADAAGYYVYLPAFFIHDFDARKFPPGIESSTGFGFKLDTVNRKVITKYYYGTAVLQAPFFLAAHGLSTVAGWDNKGYAKAYYRSIMVAAVSYLLLGLYFLKKYLEKYFTPTVTLLTLFFIYTGTNLYYYTINSGGFSHTYSFAAFSMLIFLLDKYLKDPGKTGAVLLGLLFGLIVTMRPSNAMIGLLFLFYNVAGWRELKMRIQFFFKNYIHLVCIFVFAFLMVIPQLFYWHYLTGQWYADLYVGEKFLYVTNPKIAEVLFSTNNGWITYSPLVILMLAGLLIMVKNQQKNAGLIFILLLLSLYIFSSWWNWWYGCSYGARNFVEYYAILCIPFAHFLNTMMHKTRLLKALAFIFCGICIYLNLNTIYHYDDCWYAGTWDWGEYVKIISK